MSNKFNFGEKKMKKSGFTIIELLTVIAIIVLLIGIIAPSLTKAKNLATNLKQKAQLRNIGIGLELWNNEHDNEYPDSDVLGATLFTTGAHHLAESMLGRDGYGFDPSSTWDAEADAGTAYTTIAGRETSYLSQDQFNIFQLAQVYGDEAFTGSAYPGDYNADGTVTAVAYTASVITDIFKNRKVSMPNSGRSVKTGSPILYFKAKDTDIFNDINPTISVFNWDDNSDIFALGHNITGASDPHPYNTIANFYTSNNLINSNVRVIGDPVPYNKGTFLLISAGLDRLYGTKDDITNISK